MGGDTDETPPTPTSTPRGVINPPSSSSSNTYQASPLSRNTNTGLDSAQVQLLSNIMSQLSTPEEQQQQQDTNETTNTNETTTPTPTTTTTANTNDFDKDQVQLLSDLMSRLSIPSSSFSSSPSSPSSTSIESTIEPPSSSSSSSSSIESTAILVDNKQMTSHTDDIPFGQPISTYYSTVTQYDPSLGCGKSACTFIAGLAALSFLNHRTQLFNHWELVIERAAKVFTTQRDLMLGESAGGHSHIEEAMSTLATAPECIADEFLIPLVRGLDTDGKFGVLLRSSKPRELPPRGRSRVPMLQELAGMFGEEYLVEVMADVLERCGDNSEVALNYLLENREKVLTEQFVKEDLLRETRMMNVWAMNPFAIEQPYVRPPVAQQLREYELNEEQRYRHLANRIEQEKELLMAESALYQVVAGKKGLGQWALTLIAPYYHHQRFALIFTAQMQTMCLLVDVDGNALFRDSHKNEQYDFVSVESFFAWLEDSELFTPMNDTDSEGFLDFGMVHFNKVDVYLVIIEQ